VSIIPLLRDDLPFHRSAPAAEPAIIAESPAMRRAVELARKYAPLDLPVLLIGQTGTGKEVLAQAIHRWSGRSGSLVDVDCGTLHAGTVVNELFGHRKGSYTGAFESTPGMFEAAHGGTLFLDELSSMPVEGQRALLRVVETGEVRRGGEITKNRVSVRLLGAVQKLPHAGGEDSVRLDLVHRFAGGVIHLRPLRERPEDLWPLANHLAALGGRELAEAAASVLLRHAWPGNIRELRNVIRRAAALSPPGPIQAAAVLEAIDLGSSLASECGSTSDREAMVALCRQHGNDAGQIAALLGCTRSTIYRRLQRLGIRLDDLRPTKAGLFSSRGVARGGATACDKARAGLG
jgi:DNA-binding NtrC family response regulator